MKYYVNKNCISLDWQLDMEVTNFLNSNSMTNAICCSNCRKKTEGGHFFAIRFYKYGTKIRHKCQYAVGCTHEFFDGESWCDDCFTIVNNQIMCSKCGDLDWGTPNLTDKTLEYMWLDGSMSSFLNPYKK